MGTLVQVLNMKISGEEKVLFEFFVCLFFCHGCKLEAII